MSGNSAKVTEKAQSRGKVCVVTSLGPRLVTTQTTLRNLIVVAQQITLYTLFVMQFIFHM